jgi:RNA polymerase sigma-70 factor (ECF subfamily)
MESDDLMATASTAKSDEELYRLTRKGDQAAFSELYLRREPAIYRYAMHMSGSSVVAEEVANEVFVQLMAPNAHFDERKGTLESWLYGVARNLVRVVRRLGPVEAAVDRAFEHDILGELIHGENIGALQRAMRELPERYRDVVVLCDLEERSYEDVAGLLGCPIGTVRSRLHRARALLSTKLRWLNAPAEVCSR